MKLNLGSGNVRLIKGYTTIDANPNMGPDIVARVPPIPLDDGTVEKVYCSHLLEHLTDDDVAYLMKEVWRVLELGGEADFRVPYGLSHAGIQDPTHRSLWCYEKFLYYTSHYEYLGYRLETRFQLKVLTQTGEEVKAVLRKTATSEPCQCYECLKRVCDESYDMQRV